jgi:tetratricopeptide (TPR) repeat protein
MKFKRQISMNTQGKLKLRTLFFTVMAVVATGVVLGENPDNLTDNMAKMQQQREKESDYMKLVERADEATGKGKWEEAIAYLQAAMRSEPGNAQNVMLLSNVGMLQSYMGEDSLALYTLTEARAMAPASVVILNNRAGVLARMNRLDDALNDYNLIVQMDSTYAPVYRERATIMLRRGLVEPAEADVTKYRQLAPNDSQGLLLQAVIYDSTNRYEEAIDLYGELLKRKEESVYYAARAMCSLEIDRLQDAADDIARGLELDASDPELYYCRARLNLLRYREDDAKADATKAMQLGMSPLRVKALFGK